MEITLEKIELVKDRTGVSYKEAKEALEAADGNVVDAIIAIEEQVNQRTYSKITDNGAIILEKIKEYVKKGNVARVIIRKDGDVVLNLPVNAAIVGTVLAPWLTVIGAVISLASKCDIEMVKTDGTVVDLSAAAYDTADTVREKTVGAFDTVRTKAHDAAGKAQDLRDNVASDAAEIKDIALGAVRDIKDTLKKDGADEAAGGEAPAEAAEADAGESPAEEAGKAEAPAGEAGE